MRHRKGFTLLEMLVVIGVILVLLTIAVAAYSKLVNTMATKATNATLENCRSMLGEFEQVTPISGMGYVNGQADPNFPYLSGNNYTVTDLTSNAPFNLAQPIDGTDPNFAGVVTPPNQTPWTRYPAENGDQKEEKQYVLAKHGTNAVYNTACVMMYLARLPNISAQIKQLSPKSFLLNNDVPHANPVTLRISGSESDPNASILPAPVMVDGWNNPIIFVPSSGLMVFIAQGTTKYKPGSQPNYLVRTSGIYPLNPPGAASAPPLKSTDRPFWASAGPDGNFATGDDNVYSFKP